MVSFNFILNQLKRSGLRITEPRKKLVEILYEGEKDKHVTAEVFYYILKQKNIKISLATVYNTLNALSMLGFLKKIKMCDYIVFDTDITSNGHIVNEKTGDVMDMEKKDIEEILQTINKKYQDKLSLKNINIIISYK